MCCDMKFDYLYLIFITSNAVGHKYLVFLGSLIPFSSDLSLHPGHVFNFSQEFSLQYHIPEVLSCLLLTGIGFHFLFFDSNSFFNMKLK